MTIQEAVAALDTWLAGLENGFGELPAWPVPIILLWGAVYFFVRAMLAERRP